MPKLPETLRQRLVAVAEGNVTGTFDSTNVPLNEEITECSQLLFQLATTSLENANPSSLCLDWRYLPLLP